MMGNNGYKNKWDQGRRRKAHRVIMERQLGRKLRKNEHVHHVNGDKTDNRIENLTVMDAGDHARHHLEKHPKVRRCTQCGQVFRIPNPSRKKQKTCSRQCGYKAGASAKPQHLYRDQIIAMRGQGMSMRKIAKELGISAATVNRAVNSAP